MFIGINVKSSIDRMIFDLSNVSISTSPKGLVFIHLISGHRTEVEYRNVYEVEEGWNNLIDAMRKGETIYELTNHWRVHTDKIETV